MCRGSMRVPDAGASPVALQGILALRSLQSGRRRPASPTDRSMLIPRRDLDFQVFEVLDAAGLCGLPRHAGQERADYDGVIDTAYRVAAERFAPFAAACDVEEPRIVDGKAWTIPATRAALTAFNEASFTAATFDAE